MLRALDVLPAEIDSSVREIARRAGVSHPTAASVLEGFRTQGLVVVRRTLFADEYRLNTTHILAKQLHALFAGERRAATELVDTLRTEIGTRAPWVTEAIVFGSFVRSEMRPDSDLDLALICPLGKVVRLMQEMENLSDTTVARFGNPVSAIVGTGSVQEMAQPGRRGYRLWRTTAKDGRRIIPQGGTEPVAKGKRAAASTPTCWSTSPRRSWPGSDAAHRREARDDVASFGFLHHLGGVM
ncbi:MAG: nucleotidyltransferase domain-containing protein [Actinomycetota bacterium]